MYRRGRRVLALNDPAKNLATREHCICCYTKGPPVQLGLFFRVAFIRQHSPPAPIGNQQPARVLTSNRNLDSQ